MPKDADDEPPHVVSMSDADVLSIAWVAAVGGFHRDVIIARDTPEYWNVHGALLAMHKCNMSLMGFVWAIENGRDPWTVAEEIMNEAERQMAERRPNEPGNLVAGNMVREELHGALLNAPTIIEMLEHVLTYRRSRPIFI